MNRYVTAVSILCSVLLCSCPLTVAQQPVTGTPPFSSMSGGPFDTVNLANLDVHFSIPVFSRAGKGMPFYFNLTYDGLVWVPVSSSGAVSWVPVSNWGWTAQTNAVTGYISYPITSYSCLGGGFVWTDGPFTYFDTSGTSHTFAGTVKYTNDTDNCGSQQNSLSVRATDNSGLLLNATLTSPSALTASVTTTSGIVLNPALGTVTDPNGDAITVSGGVIKDTLGTTALTISGTNPVTYQYTAPSGAGAQIKVNYSTYKVETNFGVTGINDYGQDSGGINKSLVSSIVMADGSQYSFTYEATYQGSPNTVTGRLATVTLPTGGVISYNYASTPGGTDNSMMKDGSPLRMARTAAGPWVYTRTVQSGQQIPQTTTTVIDPANNEIDVNFSGIYETERHTYTGSGSSKTLLKETHSCFNGNWTNCTTASVAAPITYQAYYDALDLQWPGGVYEFSYDQYGNLTTEKDHDYAASSPVIRQTIINYNSSLCGGSHNICNRPSNVQMTDGGGASKSYTTYGYDAGGTTNGSVTTINRHTNGTASGPSLTQSYSYNTGGTLATATDPNGTQTTYTYSNSAASCNYAFPTSVSVPGHNTTLITSYAYNCNGAVVTSVTDPNNAVVRTNYGNDPYFWRPDSSTDPLLYTTYYNYYNRPNNPAGSNVTKVGQVESVMSWNSDSGGSASDNLVTVDTLGRTELQQTLDATQGSSTWDTVQYYYDGENRVSWLTLPFTSSAGQSGGSVPATNYQYDTLGRTTLVADWAGYEAQYSYPMNDVLVTVDSAKFRQLEYDALGRLSSVCELLPTSGGGSTCTQHSAPGANAYNTTYTHDPLGNLTGVTQGGQARSFVYDGLSRMSSETNQETSQSGGNGTSTYQYDSVSSGGCTGSSQGDLLMRTDPAGNVSCYTWDGLHRLMGATYPSGPNTAGMQSKTFYYDSPQPFGITVNNPKGRLTAAVTGNNYTGEAFSYDARGQITDAYELTPHGGWYDVQQSYFPNGALAKQQGSNYTVSPPAYTTFSDLYTYQLDSAGRPYGMSDTTGGFPVTTSTTYNAASQPTSVGFHYGGSETFNYDPNSGRMTLWSSSVGSTTQTGNLTWNPNGTLKTLNITDTYNSANAQNCSYGYDDLTRLTSAMCGSSIWTQNFSYDAYGNITKTVPVGGTGTTFNLGYGSGNHVSGFSYDTMGNVTLDNLANTYAYDAEGRQVTAAGVQTTFDALGRAVEQSNGSSYTQIVYSPGGQKFAFMNGTTLKRYMNPLVAGLAAVHNGDGTGWIQQADWQGSSRLGIDTGGHVYYDRAYAPFGEVYSESKLGGATPVTTNRNFTGQTEDTTPGLYDFLFRQASQSQGRWLVPDPAGLAAVDITNPQTWNRYAYVANNPLANKDPLGLYCAVGIACSQGGGSYDAFAGTGPGGVYAAGGGGGSGFAYGGQAGSDPCGGWCSPPSSLLGNITASQDAFGEQMYQQWEQQALLDLALQAAANQAATANCIATGLQSTFGASSVTAGTSTGEVGGHWNFNFQLSFSSYDAASAFTSVYQANMGGWQPPARFGSGPALHVENPASSWSVSSDGTYSLGVTTHLDIFNPNSGFGGLAGHVGYDGVWGHIVQFLGGNIDPKNCPYH